MLRYKPTFHDYNSTSGSVHRKQGDIYNVDPFQTLSAVSFIVGSPTDAAEATSASGQKHPRRMVRRGQEPCHLTLAT